MSGMYRKFRDVWRFWRGLDSSLQNAPKSRGSIPPSLRNVALALGGCAFIPAPRLVGAGLGVYSLVCALLVCLALVAGRTTDRAAAKRLLGGYVLLASGGVAVIVTTFMTGHMWTAVSAVAAAALAWIVFSAAGNMGSKRPKLGVPAVVPAGWTRQSLAGASEFTGYQWLPHLGSHGKTRRHSGALFLVFLFAFGAAFTEAATAAFGVRDEADAIWVRITGREESTQGDGPTSKKQSPVREPKLASPPSPAVAEVPDAPCTAESMKRDLTSASGSDIGGALYRAWFREGRAEIGCLAGPVERIGSLSVAPLRGGESGASVVVSNKRGHAAVVFSSLLPELAGELDNVARIDRRLSFGVGDFQLVEFQTGSCALYTRLYEDRDYTPLASEEALDVVMTALAGGRAPVARRSSDAVPSSVQVFLLGPDSFATGGTLREDVPTITVRQAGGTTDRSHERAASCPIDRRFLRLAAREATRAFVAALR